MIVPWRTPSSGLVQMSTTNDENSVFSGATGDVTGYISPTNGDSPTSVSMYIGTHQNLLAVSPVNARWSGQ